MIAGATGTSRFAALLQRGDGGAALPTQGSRYEQVGIGTARPVLSAAFCHPSPALTVPPEDLVNVGAGRVGMGPVWVYVGNRVAAPPPLIEVGGQAYEEEKEAGIWPAPAPPVCQA